MYVVGVDLSGPAGTQNTGVAVFAVDNGALKFVDKKCDGSDSSLLTTAEALSRERPVIVGLDAPLSYEPGGGQRARDAELRREIVARGMHPGAVMAPTAPRMVYLTLRGIMLAQVLTGLCSNHSVQVVEVHPGAALCLRDAPLDAIRAFGVNGNARETLLQWLGTGSVRDLVVPSPCSSHFVAACASAVAAWDWHSGKSRWLVPAQLPWHPYDLAS
jgi:uncharacterized protein